MLHRVPSGKVKTVIELRHDVPVYHIVGLQYLHAQKMEVAGHHVVFLTDADDIRVAQIGR